MSDQMNNGVDGVQIAVDPPTSPEAENVAVNSTDNATNSKTIHPSQQNIWTKTIVLNARRYHFDLRENYRGRYLKITEVGDNRRRTILLPEQGINPLREILSSAINEEYVAESKPTENEPNVLLVSKTYRGGADKRFFFDLRTSPRGLYIKIVEVAANRSVVLVPENGWQLVLDALLEVQEAAPAKPFVAAGLTSIPVSQSSGPKKTLSSKMLVASPKKFFFDLQENEHGRFCKVAEIQHDRRSTVILPIDCWDRLIIQLTSFLGGDYESVVDGTSIPTKNEQEVAALASRVLNVENGKQFYLDLRENNKGKFLKLSEVKDHKRHTVFLPDIAFQPLKEALEGFKAVE